MSSSNDPSKFCFKLKNIIDDGQRTISISLSNNDNIKFTLTCNTNVNCPEYEGKYTVIHMYLASADKKQVSIQYRFSFLNQSDKNVKIQEGEETFLTSRSSTKYGVIYRIEQNFLTDPENKLITFEKVDPNSGFRSVVNQIVIFCCELKEMEFNSDVKDDFPHGGSFIENLETLLETGKHSDAVLFVGDKELRVHKNILAARSKVFAAMFEHDCEEKKRNRVEITDIQLDVCEKLLSYIYTAKIESMSKLAVELLVASDKYELEELKVGCEGYLMENLSIETVANILLLADLHQAKQLKAKCIDFILENGKKVLNTSGWKTLATKADLTAELFAKLTDKYENIKIEKSKMKKMLVSKYTYNSKKVDSTPKFLNYSVANLSEDIGTLIENEKFSDTVLILEDGEERKTKLY